MYKNDFVFKTLILLASFLLIRGPVFSFCQEDITVKTPLGSIQGTILTSRKRNNFYSFRGIPYAKAPIGGLRFKPPVPVEPWDGILDATKDGSACPQEKKINQSEDCLNLNIYTRHLDAHNTPVLFYIHGGSFNTNSGQSNVHGPDYLMDHDIVLVAINYRLGALGFFSTGDKYAPGNYGLKDQVEALKWVKNNIEYFGGDPTKITISGESAGAASVGLHLISPMSRGLFHRAMILSGSPINPWVVNRNPMELARKQAKSLNCSTGNSESMVDCMSKIPAEDLVNNYKNLVLWRTERRLNRPAIEVGNEENEKFLAKDPLLSVLEGDIADVPVFIGTTKDEMIKRAIRILENEGQARELSQNWTELAPIIGIYEQYDFNDTTNLKLKEFYLSDPNEAITNDSINALGDFISDSYITFGIVRFANLLSQKNKNPVYLYQYNYLGEELQVYLEPNLRGKVAHAQELIYCFYRPLSFPVKLDANSSGGHFATKFTTLWKNFVETGNPTPEASPDLDNVVWESYTKDNPKYLDINENLTLRVGIYYEERLSLWESLFPIKKIKNQKN